MGHGGTALAAPCPMPGQIMLGLTPSNRVGPYPIYTTTAALAVPGAGFGVINP